ncbi:PAS domain S-box protein [Thermodesulfobacteriota bacterium]
MAKKTTPEELEKRIEELKKEAERHHKIENKYYLLLNNIPMVTWMTDSKGNTDFISPNVEALYGYTSDEIYKRGAKLFFGRIHPDDVGKVRRAYEALFENETEFNIEYRIKHKDGHWIWLNDRAFTILEEKEKKWAYGVFTEITERKMAEVSLKESRAKYQDLYDNAPDMFLSIDFSTATIIECNKTMTETLGYRKEEIINRSVFDLYAPESAEYARTKVFPSFIKTGIIDNEELRVKKKDGSIIDVALKVSAVRDEEGKILYTRSIWRDITERKRVEKALLEERDKSQKYLDIANVILIAIKSNGEIDLINKKGCEILGCNPDDMIGKNWFDNFIPERIRKEVKSVFKKLMAAKIEPVEYFENPVLTKSGEEKIISWRNTVMKDEKGNIAGTLSSGSDITASKIMEKEKSRLEAQLIQTQKLEAIGTLAGGIAHDFNNLLMGLLGNCSLMMADTGPSNPHFEHLEEIERYVRSAVDLTKQLLGFARGGKYEVRVMDLNQLVKDHNRMFGRTKKEIVIRGKYDPDLWSVEIDSNQIGQVLMNIYVNAWQAMKDRGEIFVNTENVKLDKGYLLPFEVKSGRYVKISITDTGIGMDKETKEKIFDPFFTTKEKERGTGMGLSSAYGIIKNHGGFITVYSEPEEGSTFNIYLPASRKKARQEKETVELVLKGSGTVLLIDDEKMILDVGEQLLKNLGYDVLMALGGQEGVEVYKKNQDNIDLVILDMVMPDMTGSETYDVLKSISQDVKVLVSSGYSLNGKAKQMLDSGCDGFIQKPFNMNQLSQKVSEILNR